MVKIGVGEWGFGTGDLGLDWMLTDCLGELVVVFVNLKAEQVGCL